MHDIIVFNFLINTYFLCWFASSFFKYLVWEKYCNYPLTTTQDDRFASCENIVSRSHRPQSNFSWTVIHFLPNEDKYT